MDNYVTRTEFNGLGERVNMVEKDQSASNVQVANNKEGIADMWDAIDKIRKDISGLVWKVAIIVGVGMGANAALLIYLR